jgi:hypothetical protein
MRLLKAPLLMLLVKAPLLMRLLKAPAQDETERNRIKRLGKFKVEEELQAVCEYLYSFTEARSCRAVMRH